VVQGLAGVSQWAGRQVGRLGLRSGSANGRLRGDELAEAQAYHDRNGDERLLLDDSRKWEQRDDPNFLSRPVPLPTVTSKYAGKPHDNGKPIPYLHYSLAYDADRRMAIYTVANFDRTRRSVPARGSDPFVPDPRVPADKQWTDALYKDNPFDRGHLVGRQDIAWGPTPAPAGRPNPSAFDEAVNVFTNATPQYDSFNQGLWPAAEQWSRVEHNPAADRVTLFTGPVFRPDDYDYRGAKVPRSFWKVAVSDAGGKAGGLVVEAVIADQYDLRTPDKPP